MQFIKKIIHIDTLMETFKRFPFSSLCALIVSGIFIAELYGVFSITGGVRKVVSTLILGYFWCGGVALMATERQFSVVKTFAISIIGLVALYLFFFEMEDIFLDLRLVSVFLGLFSFISYAPFIGRSNSDNDFWVFNKDLWYGVVFSIVAALIFYAGASAALFSIKYLFDLDLGYKISALLGIISFGILAPLYSLSFVPKSTRQGETECTAPKPMAFFINWLLLPLVFFYFLILYAYFIKTGLSGDILKNDVIYMIAGFACVGIGVYLISWPLQQTVARSAKLLRKIFFPLLIIPTLIMLYAIFDRIVDFGVTEKRYCVALFGLWLLAITGLHLFGRLRLWYMFASFSILLFIISWGPWGMYNVSYISQKNRLDATLTELGLLKDNELIKTENSRDISFENRKNISSMYDYLFYHNHIDGNLYGYKHRKDFFNTIGVSYISDHSYRHNGSEREQERFNYYVRNTSRGIVDVSGYDYYIQNISLSNKPYRQITDEFKIDAILSDNLLKIEIDNQQLTIDLRETVLKRFNNIEYSHAKQKEEFWVEKSSDRFNVKISPRSMNGVFINEKRQIDYLNFSILIKKK